MTAQTGSNFDGQKEYNAIVENGKLAVNFSYSTTADVSALNALQRAFAHSGCNITEGFTNQTISPEEIQPLVIGALRTELKDGGLYVHRSTPTQISAWQALTTNYKDWTQQNPCSATGIRIEFESDTSYVSLGLSTPPTNMVVLVNNTVLTSAWSGSPWEIPEIFRGQVNRITILLSNLRGTDNWCIKSLGYDCSCTVSPCKTDINMLFIGDSITEGHDSGKKPAYTYTYYTSSYFNANAVVQGYGSSQCWTDIIEPTMAEYFTPDVIVIAMGTNDYGSNKSQSIEWFKDRMDAFLDKIEEVYPGVPIIGVTPLRRLSSMNSATPEYNYDRTCVRNANAGYAQAYEEHGALLVVAGEDILKETAHYADVLHPNADGFLVYGDALCKAIEAEIEKIIESKKNAE